MENQKYTVTSTPHLMDAARTDQIMLTVILALLPASIMGVFLFGLRAAVIILLSVASCVGFEALYQRITKQSITIKDYSAAVTGLLLGLNLSSTVPFWIPIVGAFLAIVLIKQLFGGLGHNFMNPALGARAILIVSYASEMAGDFPEPVLNFFAWDTVAAPTPLVMDLLASPAPADALTLVPPVISLDYLSLFIGTHGGTIGETSALALLIGGAILLVKKIITWHIPVIYIVTTAVLSFVLQPETSLAGAWEFPLFSLLTGGIMLGAIFMATDYSSSPITPWGKVIFGFGCGLFTVLIRVFGLMPEGVSFAILFMNLWVPLIDKWTKPRVFGTQKAKIKAKGRA